MRERDPILVIDNAKKAFGGITAVDVDHLEIPRGKITALIGPNGAGKTTLFNVLTGFEAADDGAWTFDGTQISGRAWTPSRIARAGMVRTFQLTKALRRMSVLENMTLGAPRQRGERMLGALWPPLWKAQEAEVEEKALTLLQRFGLAHMAGDYAGTLSGGQRKLLEMARALMAEPAMVLLDEPMAGVNPALTEKLLEHIREVNASGATVMFIEHEMDVVMSISDWVVCMSLGRVIAQGPPAAIRANQDVIDAYLGARRG